MKWNVPDFEVRGQTTLERIVMKKIIALILILLLVLSGCGSQATISGAPDCQHADRDDNGLCDLCHRSVLVTIDFYAINDLHGKLADGDSHPGVDELTTYLKNARRSENVVLLSVGDMWQGSAESNLTQGNIITDWMNELDFAAMTLGNHEYDWGEIAIEANAAIAHFPFLAINIYDRATNTRVDYCDASVVVELCGLQIGIIGAMGDCYNSIASDKTEDIYFKTGDALTALVKAESERLRREEGVDFIVYAIHDGWDTSGTGHLYADDLASYYDPSLSNGYVDLVFEGHTHQKYMAPDDYGVYHLQHKGDNTGGISHVEIRINSLTGSYTVVEAALISKGTYAALEDDPIVEDLLYKYKDQISDADRVVGVNSAYRSSDALCDLVAELYYELGLANWGETYDIALGGGFLSARSPYSLDAGEVTYGDLQSLFPFDNDIVLCAVSGRDLLDRFIETDNYRYHVFGNWGQIEPNGTYYIVVDTYTAYYAPNHLTVVEAYTPGVYARDLLADYIQAGGLE